MCAVSRFSSMHRTRAIFLGSATLLNGWLQYLSEARGEKKTNNLHNVSRLR